MPCGRASAPTCRSTARLDLVRLAAGVEPRKTLTETFGPNYFAGVGAEGYIPDVTRIQSTVRAAILDPSLAREQRNLASIRKSC